MQKTIKQKNTLILSIIPLKMLESEYCEANNLQNSSSRSSCLQVQGKETTTSGNTSGRKRQGNIRGKTKTTNNINKYKSHAQYKAR